VERWPRDLPTAHNARAGFYKALSVEGDAIVCMVGYPFLPIFTFSPDSRERASGYPFLSISTHHLIKRML
jgi:hypothetical protein